MSEEEAIETLKKCFEDIRGSMFWRDEWQALDIVEEYIKNSISKDKIKELINKRNAGIGYTSLECIEDIEKLLEE